MNKIITISREYGSGGRVIGKAVADKLGIPFYDRELIELSAQKSGLAVSFVEDTEQKIKNKFLHNLAFGGRYMGVEPAVSGLSLSDKLFIATCDIIREIADRGPCVIVGRCADYILKDRENIFDVFVYADDEHKANRIAQRNDMALDKALAEVKKTDKYAPTTMIITPSAFGARKKIIIFALTADFSESTNASNLSSARSRIKATTSNAGAEE